MAWVLAVAVGCAALAASRPGNTPAPLVIQDQGSFAVGGTVVTAPGTFDPIRHGAYNPVDQSVAGQTLHGDHAYVLYQVPANPRRLPLVMWHGHGQSARTWETTPDGREGFQNIFLRRRFPVYLVDQPRRGRASRSTVPMNLTAAPDEQLWFGIFRLGVWPNFFPGVQFSQREEALDQFFRQMAPNTGPFDMEVSSAAVSALFDKIGPGILVTHSQSGGLGWRTAIKNRNVRAIVSYEPGSNFPFPEGEAPATAPYADRGVPLADFMLLTKIPIVLYYGDNIPETPVVEPGRDQWRVFMGLARLWRDAVNRRGGDVTLVHLPDLGIRGNTHFPMSDLNNVLIADLLSRYLAEKKLDGGALAPRKEATFPATGSPNQEQDVISLSREKWRWMVERKVDSLATLLHDDAVFVHMGATLSKDQELDVIRSGGIVYKNVEIQEASVRLIGTTAILLNRIRLVAVVGGNEVTNHFVVTEVYVQEGGTRRLASLSFTRLLTP